MSDTTRAAYIQAAKAHRDALAEQLAAQVAEPLRELFGRRVDSITIHVVRDSIVLDAAYADGERFYTYGDGDFDRSAEVNRILWQAPAANEWLELAAGETDLELPSAPVTLDGDLLTIDTGAAGYASSRAAAVLADHLARSGADPAAGFIVWVGSETHGPYLDAHDFLARIHNLWRGDPIVAVTVPSGDPHATTIELVQGGLHGRGWVDYADTPEPTSDDLYDRLFDAIDRNATAELLPALNKLKPRTVTTRMSDGGPGMRLDADWHMRVALGRDIVREAHARRRDPVADISYLTSGIGALQPGTLAWRTREPAAFQDLCLQVVPTLTGKRRARAASALAKVLDVSRREAFGIIDERRTSRLTEPAHYALLRAYAPGGRPGGRPGLAVAALLATEGRIEVEVSTVAAEDSDDTGASLKLDVDGRLRMMACELDWSVAALWTSGAGNGHEDVPTGLRANEHDPATIARRLAGLALGDGIEPQD